MSLIKLPDKSTTGSALSAALLKASKDPAALSAAAKRANRFPNAVPGGVTPLPSSTSPRVVRGTTLVGRAANKVKGLPRPTDNIVRESGERYKFKQVTDEKGRTRLIPTKIPGVQYDQEGGRVQYDDRGVRHAYDAEGNLISRGPEFLSKGISTGARKPIAPPEGAPPLAGLKDRGSVATGSSQASSGAAQAVSQAAAAARSTGGVGSGSGNFGGVGAGSGNFNTNVGGRGVTASIRNREGISTDVGPQYQLEQLQVNQDLQGRAAAQSTAAHGIRADLPGRVAAQRLTEGRGQTRGRASTILTSGGARGLGSTPANTLGARRLVSGRTPATPVEGTQAGEAAAAQAGVQQRQGIRAEQDRAGLEAQVQADGFDPQVLRNTAQTSDTRSAGARRTSRREALIGGTGGSVSGGPGGAGGGGGNGGIFSGSGLAAQDGGDPRSLGAARQRRPGSRDQTARATGQAAASRSRQGGRPPQRGNVPERVRARRTLLGGG